MTGYRFVAAPSRVSVADVGCGRIMAVANADEATQVMVKTRISREVFGTIEPLFCN